jgi:hypothetical protein
MQTFLGIQAVALDIYGTVIASDDFSQIMPPRKGIEKFFDMCDDKKIRIVGASDEILYLIKSDLGICFARYPELNLNVRRFFNIIQSEDNPKDYSLIYRDLGILPCELLVIGDGDKDINGAIKYGCQYLRVPEYNIYGEDKWNFSEIIFE